MVFDLYPEEWWEYMTYVGLECATISELKTCGDKKLNDLGVDVGKIQKMVD